MVVIVSVEGNIGSGKSTLIARLAEYYKDQPGVVCMQEPVDIWSKIADASGTTILEKFYADPDKYAFSFQIMAYASRMQAIRAAIDNPATRVIITERCLDTDRLVFTKMLHDAGRINDIEHQVYLLCFANFTPRTPTSKIVYLQTTPDTCAERIVARSRPGEAVISREYLAACHTYQEDMLAMGEVCDTQLVLDGNADLPDTILAHIAAFIAA